MGWFWFYLFWARFFFFFISSFFFSTFLLFNIKNLSFGFDCMTFILSTLGFFFFWYYLMLSNSERLSSGSRNDFCVIGIP